MPRSGSDTVLNFNTGRGLTSNGHLGTFMLNSLTCGTSAGAFVLGGPGTGYTVGTTGKVEVRIYGR